MKTLAATALSLSMATSALAQNDDRRVSVTPAGTQASTRGLADRFTGAVRVDPLFSPRSSTRASAAYVSFEPGARTAWHTHPNGQTLVVTAGAGQVQRWGDAVQEIRTGDVVWIPPGQKHWHGAGASTGMTHMAVQEHQDGKTVDWLEQVSDAQYGAGPR